jgi:metallo-beta-lactamase family protein
MASARSTLQFLGAAGTVTGSKFLVRDGATQVLLDCGLFQGVKALRERNWKPLPFVAQELDAVVLSHAHVDHSGALPLLVKRGFRGSIYCTAGTADLLEVMLLDAARLQEEEASFANRHGYSKHHPALPLYTTADAEKALRLLAPRPRGDSFVVRHGTSARFRQAGHILGSSTVELRLAGSSDTLVFSGDLGRWKRPILHDPELVTRADVLLLEATYGDRVHRSDATAELARVINETVERGGVLIVPAFAVGRTQELLWAIRKLEDDDRIPVLPVYVDSPMAVNVTDIYARHPEEHDLEMRLLTDARRSPLSSHRVELVRTVEGSRALNERSGPMIVIAGSGMATGGRVLHHLHRRLPDERSTVLLCGFQAAGTRGRALEEGAKSIRLHGEDVVVRARVASLDGFSAHADRNDLVRWLRGFRMAPREVYLVHGEPQACESLAELIRTQVGWRVRIAADGEVVELAE